MQTLILNANQINKKISRIAYQIYETHYDEKEIILAGIAQGGYLLAERIKLVLQKISPLTIQLLKVEIDKTKPLHPVEVDVGKMKHLTGKAIILVDDVLNTGTVLAYSMKAFLNYSVKSIHIAVLIDRNHTIFPIKSDYTGLSIATTLQEHIIVDLENKGKESVALID
jgi:pyrimidine operon attenuation protein / uracil phosphoribosyltransferase